MTITKRVTAVPSASNTARVGSAATASNTARVTAAATENSTDRVVPSAPIRATFNPWGTRWANTWAQHWLVRLTDNQLGHTERVTGAATSNITKRVTI